MGDHDGGGEGEPVDAGTSVTAVTSQSAPVRVRVTTSVVRFVRPSGNLIEADTVTAFRAGPS